VLQQMRDHRLFAKRSKCSFGEPSVAYLGHIITAEGVTMDPDKVAAVEAWPQPRSVRALRGFLGLTGYYRKFIVGYGGVAAPLTALLKREAFTWTAEAEAAFLALKTVLITAPLLQLPDFTKRFVVDCDASGAGFGAVLHQGDGAIAFFSRPVAPHHAKLPAYERELIGLVKAVRHWRPYLWGRAFTVRTDHWSLKFLLDQRLTTIPQHTWVSKLFGYDLTVEYRAGRLNTVADALSRRDEGAALLTLSGPLFTDYDTLRQELREDAAAKDLCHQLAAGTAPEGWQLVDGLLLYNSRVFVPEGSSLWPQLLRDAHEAGHEGAQKTLHRLRASFYHSRLHQMVRNFVRGCPVCQRNKTEHLHSAGLLQPLPVPTSIWSDIAMDFVEGFPRVGGKSVILTIVDRFSKMAHFVALSHPYSAQSVARAFFDNIIRLYGFPCSIVSDRDTVFTSHFWEELFKLAGVKLLRSSAFHPQTDGQSEVTNRIIVMYLRCLAGDRPRSWLQWLPWAEFCFNTSYQSALRSTPFEVVYGRAPPTLMSYTPGTARVAAVGRQLQDRDTFLTEIRERLILAQDTMREHHNKKRRDVEFAVGEWVLLRLHQRTAVGITAASPSKLAARYFGPYQVVERLGAVAYRLQLPPKARIHDVFHVALLKKFVGVPPAAPMPLPAIFRGRVVPTPTKVVRARLNRGRWELLVQWEGLPAADATWEPIADFKERYPTFQLEDELFVGEEGNVVDSFIGRQYRRKARRATSG